MSVIEMNNFKEFLKAFIDIGHNVTDDTLNEIDKLTDKFIKNVDINKYYSEYTIYNYFAYLRDNMTNKNFDLIHLYFGEIEFLKPT